MRFTAILNERMKKLSLEYAGLYSARDFRLVLEEIRQSDAGSRPSLYKTLYGMFRACGIAFETRQTPDEYEALLRREEDAGRLMTDAEKELKLQGILVSLADTVGIYRTPAEYMQRLVENLTPPDERVQGETVRLSILKRMVGAGGCLVQAGFGSRAVIRRYAQERAGEGTKCTDGNMQLFLDDGIFDLMNGADKEELKPKGKYGLLRLADDLAQGRFRPGGATRRSLYLFAIVYDMTYEGEPDRPYDAETDLEKNLFRDYYNDNVLRQTMQVYQQNRSGLESEPVGMGINYKNYAEVIHLYYLCRRDMDIPRKLSGITSMMERVRVRSQVRRAAQHGTSEMKALITKSSLSQSEEAFAAFVEEHYDCSAEDARQPGRTLSPFQVRSEQQTADRLYRQLLDELEQRDPDITELTGYGLMFTDLQSPEARESLRQSSEKLCSILLSVDDALRRQDWHETGPENVSRTKLLYLYYYLFNYDHAQESVWDLGGLFDAFRYGIDPLLEEAGYMPLSTRSLIDVILVFSSYYYLRA